MLLLLSLGCCQTRLRLLLNKISMISEITKLLLNYYKFFLSVVRHSCFPSVRSFLDGRLHFFHHYSSTVQNCLPGFVTLAEAQAKPLKAENH